MQYVCLWILFLFGEDLQLFFYISAFNFITARQLLFIVQAIAFLKSPISVCPSNLKLYISSLKILSCYAC